MGDSEPLLRLALAGGSEVTFRTADQLENWVAEAREFRSVLGTPQNSQVGCVHHAHEALNSVLSALDQCVTQLRAEPDNAAIARSCESQCRSRFPRGLPFPGSDVAVAIDALRDKYEPDGPAAQMIAACAVVFSESLVRAPNLNLQALNHSICFEALGYWSAFRDGWAPAKRALGREVARSSRSVSARLEEADKRLGEIESRCESVIDHLQQTATAKELDLEQRASVSIGDITKTHHLYLEALKIKAPVSYWGEKAKEHKESVKTYRKSLAGFSIGTFIVLGAIYWTGWRILSEVSGDKLAETLYIAGFVGASTAAALWFIRIIVRLYMSHHHLSIDAEERVALLRTYLALTEEGKISESERNLVLAAVFRPVPDGIVKDDGAPGFTPATMLASLLDRK